MIKQLSNSVIAKYCDLSMSRRSIICLSLRLRQIIDLLATDKSQYFAQPRPIIVKYVWGNCLKEAQHCILSYVDPEGTKVENTKEIITHHKGTRMEKINSG